MKRLLQAKLSLILIIGLIASKSFGQFEIGGAGSIASAWLMNKNVSNAGNSEGMALALSYNYGFHLGIDFTDNFGVVGNLLFGSYSQGYTGTFGNAGVTTDNYIYFAQQSYKATTTIKTMDIPVMFRFQGASNSFVELGAQYSIINGATYTANYTNPSDSRSFSTTPYFASSAIFGLLGFGDNFGLTDNLFIVPEFRILYSFTDLKGTDAMGQDLNNSNLYSGGSPMYPSGYQPTHMLMGTFTLGIFYYIETDFTHHTGHQKCKGPARVRG